MKTNFSSCILWLPPYLAPEKPGQSSQVLLEVVEVEEWGRASFSFLPTRVHPPPSPQATCMLCTRKIKKMAVRILESQSG